MPGLTTPWGGSTVQTTQTQTPPPAVAGMQGNLLNASSALLNPYLQPQNFTMAPMNADQTGAFDLTRSLAQSAFGAAPRFDNGAVGTAVNAGSAQSPANAIAFANGADPSTLTSPVGSAMTPGLPQVGNGMAPNLTTLNGKDYNYTPSLGSAAQVTGDSIRALLNPYTQDEVDTSIATINRNAGNQAARQAAQYAAAGAFGGSRQALGAAQLARSTGEQVASTTAQLMSAGYDRATATALANAQMENSMRSQNMAAQNQAGQFNAQMGYNAAQANNSNQLSLYGASQTAQQQQFNRQLQAIQALLGVGNQQQQYYNQAVQQPLTYLQLLGQLTPSNYGGTTVGTQPNTAQSPLQTLLGVGTSLAGLALRR